MNIQKELDAEDAAQAQFFHWADLVADKIIRTRSENGRAKAELTCASGITPSGTVHIGNFREIISVELIVRALRERGQKVRFIYSWDDYDVFRKVPKNMPQPEMLANHLRWPITLVPDPFGQEESYARHHEVAVEKMLPLVGIQPAFLYQAAKYRASEYAAMIRLALEKKGEIRAILDEFRTEGLKDDWWPISVFSSFTNKDTTTILDWDGEWGVTYRCDETQQTETVDLRTTKVVKLPWRIDWPMRWKVEGVDFEPAGKDHHSEGGSWSTAEKICRAIFDVEPPITFQYDFLSIKGRGGKISSSSGEVIDLNDVLEVYTPELTRYLFAGTRPNTEFSISFDLDVIKIYEDFDRTERYYYGAEVLDATHAETAARNLAKEKRIYELSQIDAPLPFLPLQIPFRHLCNLLLIYNGQVDAAIGAFPDFGAALARGELDEGTPTGRDNWRRLRTRAQCAWRWVQDFAPEDMKFSLRQPNSEPLSDLSPDDRQALGALRDLIAGRPGTWGEALDVMALEDKALQDAIYQIARVNGLEPKAFFVMLYRILVGKTQGPRLASFIKTLGKDHLSAMLKPY